MTHVQKVEGLYGIMMIKEFSDFLAVETMPPYITGLFASTTWVGMYSARSRSKTPIVFPIQASEV